MTSDAAREAQLEAMVNAALGGHDLAPFAPVGDEPRSGYMAGCRRCGRTVWVSEKGLVYNLLADECPGTNEEE